MNKKRLALNKSKGFTIIEVLVFITLISLIFITVSYAITKTLQNTKFNEYKLVATHHVDELQEWLRYQKEADWSSFITHNETYCFNQTEITWGYSGSCTDFLDDSYNMFKRSVTFTPDSSTQMSVHIEISWTVGSGVQSVVSDTVFSLLE